MKGFWETVRALRARAGHSSARAFHDAWRRRGAGACGYKAYCEIEAGRLVPSPALAASLAAALGLRPGTRQAEAFRGAYLFSATRRRNLARVLLQSLCPADESPGLADRMLNTALERKRHVLTAEQRRLVMEDPAARRCCILLNSCARPWTPAAVASALGMSVRDARAALRRLAAAGLARGRGAYASLQGNDIAFPRPTPAELKKMGSSFFSGFPVGSWCRHYAVLFRAGHAGARRLVRRAEKMVTGVRVLHRPSGAGGVFSVGAFVWDIS